MTDELKPVRCGCGGEAIVDQTDGYDEYQVYCPKCFMSSGTFNTEAEAITAWNLAMSGVVVAKNATTERTAKVVEGQKDSWYCTGCGKWCDKGEDIYCAHCGCRLEWE